MNGQRTSYSGQIALSLLAIAGGASVAGASTPFVIRNDDRSSLATSVLADMTVANNQPGKITAGTDPSGGDEIVEPGFSIINLTGIVWQASGGSGPNVEITRAAERHRGPTDGGGPVPAPGALIVLGAAMASRRRRR